MQDHLTHGVGGITETDEVRSGARPSDTGLGGDWERRPAGVSVCARTGVHAHANGLGES